MSYTTLIELRQLEGQGIQTKADGTQQNGQWETVLDGSNAVMLEEGDQVQVKAVWLDTSAAASGFIEVAEDTDITMTSAMYLQNYNKDQNYDYLQLANPPAPGALGSAALRRYGNGNRTADTNGYGGDNNPWFLSEVNIAGSNKYNITTATLTVLHPNSSVRYYGGVDIIYEYTKPTDPAGTFGSYWALKLHPARRTERLGQHNPYLVNVICSGTPTAPDFRMTFESAATLSKFGIAAISLGNEPITDTTPTVTLQEFETKFTVPQGSYTPLEMSQLITSELNSVEQQGKVNDNYGILPIASKTEWPVMSNIMTTVLKNNTEITAKNATTKQIFVNASGYENSTQVGLPTPTDRNGVYYFDYDIDTMEKERLAQGGPPYSRPPLDRYIGTNQIALLYDELSQKLKFDIMHFPIYTGATVDTGISANDALPSVLYNSADTIGNIFVTGGLATRYSGIVWTSLQPPTFWNEMLGFSDITVSPSYTSKMNYPGASDTITVNNSFKMPVKEGVNVTGGFPGLDLAVVHDDTNFATPIFQDPSGTILNVAQKTNDVSSIFSKRTFNSSLAEAGYFLLDIQSNIQQKLVSSKLATTHTQSIINRYYTANSFTSDTGNGSILYTHVGEPQMLSSFKVTVRNPDRSLVDGHILQPKNTVFIEVIKPLKELEAPPPVGRTAT
tara:strand:+ start:5320 stop:7338 length:2019 start_codon:yes stop_codon:yes gene_type:complete